MGFSSDCVICLHASNFKMNFVLIFTCSVFANISINQKIPRCVVKPQESPASFCAALYVPGFFFCPGYVMNTRISYI